MSAFLTAVTVVAVAFVGCFSLRRLLLLGAAVVSRRAVVAVGSPPSVALVVAARNERPVVDRILGALDALEYPREQLSLVLVDDGSSDGTAARLEEWVSGRASTQLVRLERSGGKFVALAAGIAAAPPADVIAICDADLRPHPTWLAELVQPYGDPRVGATAGFLSPTNATHGPIARYAAVETWVHQLVTSAGEDRLDLNPPTLGACSYRRAAFDEVGDFGGGGAGGDIRISAALTAAGWRIRFVPTAVADNLVVFRWRDYWHQHVRWARNVLGSARAPRGRAPSPSRRLEAWFAAAGYLDRLAFLLLCAVTAAGAAPPALGAGYLAVAGAEVVAALLLAGRRRDLPLFVLATILVFAVDVAASFVAVGAQALRRPRRWRPGLRDMADS